MKKWSMQDCLCDDVWLMLVDCKLIWKWKCLCLLSHACAEQRQLRAVNVLMSNRLPDLCYVSSILPSLGPQTLSALTSSPSCRLTRASSQQLARGPDIIAMKRTRACVAWVATVLTVSEPDAYLFSTSSMSAQRKLLFPGGEQTEGHEQ